MAEITVSLNDPEFRISVHGKLRVISELRRCRSGIENIEKKIGCSQCQSELWESAIQRISSDMKCAVHIAIENGSLYAAPWLLVSPKAGSMKHILAGFRKSLIMCLGTLIILLNYSCRRHFVSSRKIWV